MPQKKVALVRRVDVREARNGQRYATLSLNLGPEDAGVQREGKIWQVDRLLAAGRELPQPGTLIEVAYTEEEYRGALQWRIEDYRLLDKDETARLLPRFRPASPVDGADYQARLKAFFDRLDPGRVSARIARDIFARPGFCEAFALAPAATSHHQQYPGGLLEHTINVTTLALGLAEMYAGPNGPGLTIGGQTLPVDRGLLIAAGLLHDVGKIQTYTFAPAADVTDAHRFEGHLALGYAWVRAVAAPLREKPPYPGAVDEIDKLLNCILSHHGQLEFGSPVLPACVEAFLLSVADVADARVASIVGEGRQLLRQNPSARWLQHPHFPGGMFIGDWPPEADRRP